MSGFIKALCLALLLISCAQGQRSRRDPKDEDEEPDDTQNGERGSRQRRMDRVFTNTPYPYACTLSLNMTDPRGLCTGILVNASWVVTAAHCLDNTNPEDIVIFCDGDDSVEHEVEEIVVHEEWLGINRLPYDIAMVKLTEPSELPVVNLAEEDMNITKGHLHVIETDNEGFAQEHTEATYMEHELCNSRFHWTRSVDDDVVCATTQFNRCMSDAGSALLYVPHFDSKPAVLFGIASFETKQCNRHEFPIVYTAIGSYVDWILAVIEGFITSFPDADEIDEERNKLEETFEEYENASSRRLLNAAVSAIVQDDDVILSVLLDLGLSPDARLDEQERSLLHLCATQDAHKCAKLLVERGANVGIIENGVSATPLHFAATSGSVAVAKILVEAGAYVNAVDSSDSTPLHYVITGRYGRLIMVIFLLEAGGNPHSADSVGATPLHYAAAKDWVSATKVLVRAGGNLVVFADDNGSPLHWAARSGADESIRVLILAGTDVEVKPNKGLNETALLFGIRQGAPLSTVKVLVNFGGANVNVVDTRGNTPLHRAAQSGDPKVIQFLVRNGGNTRSRNRRGDRPLDVYCDFYNCNNFKNEDTRDLLKP